MKKIWGLLFFLSSIQGYASCPTHLRFIHGEAFRDEPISIMLNNQSIYENLSFRSVTSYREFPSGKYKVDFVNTRTGELLDSKTFIAGTNLGYTIMIGGPAKGPEGMKFGNTSPFIFVDDVSPVSNPNRWKGAWYRLSETDVVIDFRISAGENYEVELGRLKNLPNRASYQLGDFPKGVYNFNPVLLGSKDPLLNMALEPAKNVEVRGLYVEGGENVDIIALGNFLGRVPNSLDLVTKKYKSTITDEGCFQIQN